MSITFTPERMEQTRYVISGYSVPPVTRFASTNATGGLSERRCGSDSSTRRGEAEFGNEYYRLRSIRRWRFVSRASLEKRLRNSAGLGPIWQRSAGNG